MCKHIKIDTYDIKLDKHLFHMCHIYCNSIDEIELLSY